jgi:hypothetical protein
MKPQKKLERREKIAEVKTESEAPKQMCLNAQRRQYNKNRIF